MIFAPIFITSKGLQDDKLYNNIKNNQGSLIFIILKENYGMYLPTQSLPPSNCLIARKDFGKKKKEGKKGGKLHEIKWAQILA